MKIKMLKCFAVILLISLCVPLFACNKVFKECSSQLLDISKNNYTIEICDGSKYEGKYLVTNSVIKKVTNSYTYYYFMGDENRYYRDVNGWNKSKDNNEIHQTISIVKDFFISSKKLYANRDYSIFKTKTGNLIYDINSTKIDYSNFDTNLKNIEMNDLVNNQNYIITPSAIKIISSSNITLYLKKPTGLLKFNYENSQWIKKICDIESLETLKQNLLLKLNANFIEENKIYLSVNGISVKEYNGSLSRNCPDLSSQSYTLKDFSNEITYIVTKKFIKIINGSNLINAYHYDNGTIYEFSSNNYNNHITKEVCTKFNSMQQIMEDVIDDFVDAYGNTLNSKYVIVGSVNQYELSKINSTSVTILNETAQKVEDISLFLNNATFTIKDKIQNHIYTKSDNILEIINCNQGKTKYYQNDNGIIYEYYFDDNWIKKETEYQSFDEVMDFEALFEDINNDKILKLLYGDEDFVSQNYIITNYNKDIKIDLPSI